MKNNKGYYSWIHSMKNAAMESHFKGKQMINEAKEVSQGKKKQLNEAREDENWEGPNLPREDFYKLAKQIADLLKQDGGITPESIQRAGGDPTEYAKIRDLKVKDANNDGTVNASDVDVTNKLDAADGVPDTKIGPRFTNPLAAQARLEMGHGVEGDEELAAKLKTNSDEPEPDMEDKDYLRRTMMPDENTVMRESLNQKISRILREGNAAQDVRKAMSSKRPIRGTTTPGAVESVSRFGDMPFEFSKGGVHPLAKILDVLSNPNKHPKEHVMFAQDALNAIQSELKDR